MKNKSLLYSIIIIFLLLLLGIYLITQDENNKISKTIKDNTPSSIKNILKKTVFYIPLKFRESQEIRIANKELKEKNSELTIENNALRNKLFEGEYEKDIKDEYLFESFVVPFISKNDPFNRKSQAYLEIFDNKIIVIFWSGKIIFFEKDVFDKKNFDYKEIKNNISQKKFFDNNINWTGIRDALVLDDKIYLSLTEEIRENCYMTSIIKADLNFENLEFSSVFKPTECTDISKQVENFRYFNGHQTGGRLVFLDGKLYLTIGDYNSWEYVQDDKSIIGKILQINPDNGEYILVTKGHRNQQGLAIFSEEKKLLISSEHGPKGGDEINLIDLKENLKKNNFGWPISSYGTHYDVVPINKFTKKYAPLNKSHREFDFKEPIKYFLKAIAPSQIIKNYYSVQNQFILSTLGKESLYFLEIDAANNLEVVQVINTGERIRDIIYDKLTNSYFILQENTGTPKVVKISKME